MLNRILRSLEWRWQALISWGRSLFSVKGFQWARVVMNRRCEEFVRSLNCAQFSALEISGDKWRGFGFSNYRNVQFPEYDICSTALDGESFDLIIAEQVLEHVPRPYRAVQNVFQMLKPGGFFIVNTPFLIRIHEVPNDYSRWTEAGLKQLLVEGGFQEGKIQTGSWGNRACVRGTFNNWSEWIPWLDSLENEPRFPVVVWAFAQR